MVQQTVERVRNIRNKRERARLAINLAMESRWEEAVAVNREVLADAPEDVEALNRLGKALSELGCYSQAREAFQRVLALQSTNTIAKKNLERLVALRDSPQQGRRPGVPPHFFIEEIGKTGFISLVDLAPKDVLFRMMAGETVHLEPDEHKLLVKNSLGEYVGTVEPRLGLRLLRLMRGGNRYEGAIASIGEKCVRVIVKESYQHPSQIGRLSFPAKGVEDFRSHVWEGALRYGAEEDGEALGESEEWEEEEESVPSTIAEYARFRGRGRRRGGAEEEEES